MKTSSRHPLIFVVTSISISSARPGRILPQLVERDELSGQLRDVGRRDHRRRHRHPLAGLFVAH